MKRLIASLIAVAMLAVAVPADADRRHERHFQGGRHFDRGGHHHSYRHHRGFDGGRHRGHYRGHREARIAYRPAPYYWGGPRYYYGAPVHYHYHGGHYRSHYGNCDSAYLWIGGAMVLTELLHHGHHGH